MKKFFTFLQRRAAATAFDDRLGAAARRPDVGLRPVRLKNRIGRLAGILSDDPVPGRPRFQTGKYRPARNGADETIPVGSPARTLYLLGMINDGWDSGLAHWGEHFELRETREDQVQIGTSIGEIETATPTAPPTVSR